MWSKKGLFLWKFDHIGKFAGSLATIDRLELVMPKYAGRGGEATLKCDHSVPLEQLHKVEWKKSGMKIFQYVKGRTPPFRYFPIAGAELNKEHSSEKQIQLSKLDFSASGSYSCIVSMETPIFSKESESHELTVIELQDGDPVITFNKDTYEIGEILEANCTTSPARPPPHVTWLINNERVDDSLTKPFSNGRLHGHGYFERKSSSTTQLSVEVSELHGGEDGVLRLTCVSTIPGYVSHNEKYADIRQHSVINGKYCYRNRLKSNPESLEASVKKIHLTKPYDKSARTETSNLETQTLQQRDRFTLVRNCAEF
ncbi:hypothetical protein FQR65_LT01388 [Abscondita terminalis]|nr:hypothetical protein FQR65_LT01388 [Abscondita terminalis]